jgi:hypothetical protein
MSREVKIHNMRHVSPITRIDTLHRRCLDLVEREVSRLADLAIVEKLGTAHAKDLRDYIKLLADMKREHQAIIQARKDRRAKSASNASVEQLEKALQKG